MIVPVPVATLRDMGKHSQYQTTVEYDKARTVHIVLVTQGKCQINHFVSLSPLQYHPRIR